jgi:multidrug efflux pump subunit AcrB
MRQAATAFRLILVDDATVEVENINRNRGAEPDSVLDEIVLESASQIATPAFVARLSICIVFAPMSRSDWCNSSGLFSSSD